MVLNIPWIHVCQVSAYADVAQGYVCICLHMNTINKGFFSKISTLFSIFKKNNGGLSSHPPAPSTTPTTTPSCGPVIVAEYGSILSMNMFKCPWNYLNKLFRLWQDPEYAWSSYMFDILSKMTWVLNKPGFCKWHGCIWKAQFRIWLIMIPYASICLNVPQYAWTWLNIAEYFWIYLKIPE